MPNPSVLYATDEDIKVRCSGDFDMLAPADQSLAAGTDGAINVSSPWVLNSVSANFAASGLTAGNVISLKLTVHGPATHFAVVSVTTNATTFRRVGMLASQGQPPVIANVTGLTYSVQTFRAQIEDASYDLNRRFGINDDFADRQASYLYDARELRQACVLTVLMRQYATESRTKDGDFASKLTVVSRELDDVLARISVKFGSLGQGSEPVNRFSMRVRR